MRVWISTGAPPVAALVAAGVSRLGAATLTAPIAAATALRRAFAAMNNGGRAVLIGPVAPAARPGSIAAALVEGALISLTRSLAAEKREKGITVNMLLPREDGHDAPLDAVLRFLLTGRPGATGLALPVSILQDACRNDMTSSDIDSSGPEDSR